jgi:hypothetical protein
MDLCDAVDGGACPEAERLRCRLGRLHAAASGCAIDDDCATFRFPPNCLEYGRCPSLPVKRTAQSGFSIEASEELSTFCTAVTCRPAAGACAQVTAGPTRCVKARCVVVVSPAVDAGVDGGR